jgi:hypothetical protein
VHREQRRHRGEGRPDDDRAAVVAARADGGEGDGRCGRRERGDRDRDEVDEPRQDDVVVPEELEQRARQRRARGDDGRERQEAVAKEHGEVIGRAGAPV